MVEYIKFIHNDVAYYYKNHIITQNEFMQNIKTDIKVHDIYSFHNMLKADFVINIKTNAVIKSRYGFENLEFILDKFIGVENG